VRSFRSLPLLVAACACALVATGLAAYSSGPPPAHTGGFGEPDCTACHLDYDLNEPGASIRLDSLPETYEPGRTYSLMLTVRHAELKRGGFQLSARHADGTNAGTFVLPDSVLLRVRSANGVDYLSHTMAGADQVTGDSIVWRFAWTAPEGAPQQVVFHAAINVTNRDASEFGDRIFTAVFHSGQPTQ
jgi:hypothetical protein